MARNTCPSKKTSPAGQVKYLTGAFPSACWGNLAMLIPTIPGWKVRTVGDDIAWMKLRTVDSTRSILNGFSE